MSRYQSPPHCEERPYPKNSMGTILSPDPWRVSGVNGPADLVVSMFREAESCWHRYMGLEKHDG